jgi:hypothetical protein
MSGKGAADSNMDSEASMDNKKVAPEKSPQPFKKGPRFWAIMVVLALAGLLTALEATITSTVLPVIVAELDGGDSYIWVANAYFLTT